MSQENETELADTHTNDEVPANRESDDQKADVTAKNTVDDANSSKSDVSPESSADDVTPSSDIPKDTEKSSSDSNPPAKPDPAREHKLRKEAKRTLADARKLFKRAKSKLAEDRQQEVTDAITALENALKNDGVSCESAHEALKTVIDKRLKFAKKSSAQEVVESLLFALAFALVLRTFFVEPFKIPSRSMVPTLLEGDQLFVTKLSYGIRIPFYDKYITWFSKPERGEVIVFQFPRKEAAQYLARTNSGCLQAESLAEDKDYIKRIIGVEGDSIEVIDQVIYVNGEPVAQQPFYERTVSDYMFLTDKRRESWNREMHGDAVYTTITHELPPTHFGPVKVAPGHVFVMGDNRDNSADSRCWGQVPVDYIKGRAQIIWWSGGHVGPRWERMFTKIQ